MATTEEFILFVCGQIQGDYDIRYRKMFGEYMVYANDKPILLVCDNRVFVKQLPQVDELMKDAVRGVPYAGAKEHYVLDTADKKLTAEVVELLERITPLPKKRK